MPSYFESFPRIPFEGPASRNPLAFRFYERDRKVLGKRLEDQLRCAVCFWHTFAWSGGDTFGLPTFDRPWQQPGDVFAQAQVKVDAAFEFFEKLGAPYYTFHDRDVLPAVGTFRETTELLRKLEDRMAAHQQRTGVRLLWGTAALAAHPRYMSGAATNPDPEVFAFAAAQVKVVLEMTHRLKGENYVLWGGREGYETLLNTDMKREQDQLGRFMAMVAEHKHKIGFTG